MYRSFATMFFVGLASIVSITAYGQSQSCIQQPSGVYYCPASYLVGPNVVAVDMVSTLPSGNLTIQEKNICPSSYFGGSLYGITQFIQIFTNASLINGEIYGQWPPVSPGAIIQKSGDIINTYGPPFPSEGNYHLCRNFYSGLIFLLNDLLLQYMH